MLRTKSCILGPLVDESELHMDRGVKVIEKIAVALKNLRFVVRLRELVVNIKELYRLGVKIAAHTADTVPVHFLIGNTLLDRLRGVRFQPGKKAGPFLRPGRRGSFTSCLSCFGAGLFCLLYVSLQTFFLRLLLFGFWQSVIPPFWI